MSLLDTKTSEELYDFLLNDIYENNNINNNKTEQIKIYMPEMQYDISKKMFWKNFKLFPELFKRKEEHLVAFVNKELKTTVSINIDGYLVLDGKTTLNVVQRLLEKYIDNYVKCSACKTINTTIIRNINLRIDFLKCGNCNVETAVNK